MLSTFRVKISLIAAALVLVLIVGVYLATVQPLATRTEEGVRKSVQRASSLVIRSQNLHGYDLLATAQSLASDPGFAKGIQIAKEDDRRSHVFDAVDQADKQLKKRGRKADFLGVVDTEGAIIARDLKINNLYGEKLPYKNIQKALNGEATRDVWKWKRKNSMMRSAAAPIFANGKVIGAVVIAYEYAAVEAREERDQFGTQVAYFMGKVRASSFSQADDDNREDAQRVAALDQVLFSGPMLADKALSADKPTELTPITLNGEEYLAIVGPLPGRLTEKKVGYVALASVDAAGAPVSRVRWMFLVLGLAMLVLLLGGMFLVSQHYVSEEDKLELGVNEVINGNLDYTFEHVEEFEGLANAINVMLARLLGRPEPGEEEEAEAWRSDVLFVDEVTGDHTREAQRAVQLASETEEQYYVRVHSEYITTRKKYNLSVDGITLESLTQKLKANEGLLKAKHKCKAVRFEVREEAGKVSLKPIRIP